MDDFDEDYEHPSYRWSWRSALVYVGDWATGVLNDTADMIGGLTMQLAADVNYRVDQRTLHQEMALELETLLEENE